MDKCHVFESFGPHKVSLLGGGRNNRVLLVESESGKYIAKCFSNEKISQGKFDREVAFLEFCGKLLVAPVPKLVVHCPDHGVVVTTFETGSSSQIIVGSQARQILAFLMLINENSQGESAFVELDAIESLFSKRNFQESIDVRTARVAANQSSTLKASKRIEEANSVTALYLASDQYRDDLEVLADLIEGTTRTVFGKKFLSPSDLGSHNILIDDGKLVFIDFEYSGLDSGINLLGDTITQPDTGWALGVRETFTHELMTSLFGVYSYDIAPVERLFTLRWILIMIIRAQKPIDPIVQTQLLGLLDKYLVDSQLRVYRR